LIFVGVEPDKVLFLSNVASEPDPALLCLVAEFYREDGLVDNALAVEGVGEEVVV